jgi:hypothetical protein
MTKRFEHDRIVVVISAHFPDPGSAATMTPEGRPSLDKAETPLYESSFPKQEHPCSQGEASDDHHHQRNGRDGDRAIGQG